MCINYVFYVIFRTFAPWYFDLFFLCYGFSCFCIYETNHYFFFSISVRCVCLRAILLLSCHRVSYVDLKFIPDVIDANPKYQGVGNCMVNGDFVKPRLRGTVMRLLVATPNVTWIYPMLRVPEGRRILRGFTLQSSSLQALLGRVIKAKRDFVTRPKMFPLFVLGIIAMKWLIKPSLKSMVSNGKLTTWLVRMALVAT